MTTFFLAALFIFSLTAPAHAVEAAEPAPAESAEPDRSPASQKIRRPAQNPSPNPSQGLTSDSRPRPRRPKLAPTPPPDAQTEYFWQPKGGHSSIQAAYSASSSAYELKNLGGSTVGNATVKSLSADLDFRYGISDQLSLGVEWSPVGMTSTDTSTSGNSTTTRTSSGFGDLHVSLLTTSELDSLRIHYGVSAGLPVVGAKSPAPSSFSPAATSNADGNMSSGGFSLTALLGLSMKVEEAHHFGGKIAFSYFGPRSVDAQDGTSTTSTGGNSFLMAGFYEFHLDRFYISPIVSAELSDASVDTNSGRNSTNDQHSATSLETDAGWWISRSFLISARLGYQLRQEAKVGSFKYGGGAPLYGLAGRYEF